MGYEMVNSQRGAYNIPGTTADNRDPVNRPNLLLHNVTLFQLPNFSCEMPNNPTKGKTIILKVRE